MPDEEKSAAAQAPRRRSMRIILRVPLLINTAEESPDKQWEPVMTLVVSQHGGMVRTQQEFRIGSTLDIRMRDKEKSALARVVWASSKVTPQGIEMGFELIGQTDFWDITFPADRRSEPAQPGTSEPDVSSGSRPSGS